MVKVEEARLRRSSKFFKILVRELINILFDRFVFFCTFFRVFKVSINYPMFLTVAV